uniref:Integrase catalytic domain-containing protein n=1 Tax=Fagus sylvatica TaxID=28930 RepID=A0A2N9FVX8_FAGSY
MRHIFGKLSTSSFQRYKVCANRSSDEGVMAPGSRGVGAVFVHFSDADSGQTGDAIGEPRVPRRSRSHYLSNAPGLADQLVASRKDSAREGGSCAAYFCKVPDSRESELGLVRYGPASRVHRGVFGPFEGSFPIGIPADPDKFLAIREFHVVHGCVLFPMCPGSQINLLRVRKTLCASVATSVRQSRNFQQNLILPCTEASLGSRDMILANGGRRNVPYAKGGGQFDPVFGLVNGPVKPWSNLVNLGQTWSKFSKLLEMYPGLHFEGFLGKVDPSRAGKQLGQTSVKLRCLSPEEANYVIREVHEGICGNHSGARALAHKLTRAGYYWPSLLHDATQYVKTCDKCQRFANIPRAPPEEITPMTSPWPFAQWGLDIMGPFPVGTKQAKFLVVAIDYFTKWVEAEPLATITEKNVKNFVWKGVICRFGIPRVLVSDNGKQFDNGPFRELCAQLNIKNHYSSPRHPQANGQVEVTNRTLLKQIKTRLEGAKGMWVEELPSILWAYRTTVRIPTGETPFKLTFGTEAVIPVEIGLTTLRTTFHKEEENEGQLRLNLDLLDETRDKAARRITLYQEKMAKYYNTKVKLRRFEIGDWVLRKITQATKDPSQGKLGPNWEGPYKVIQYYRRGTYHLEDRHGKKLPHPWNAEHLKKYYP